MTDVHFDKNLGDLEQDVLSLSAMVQRAIERAIDALRQRDLALAGQIVREDRDIDARRFEIEQKCMGLIGIGLPDVSERRFVVSVLGIITELERMGDYAEGIANITLMIGDQPPLKPLIDIPRMAQRAREMLRGSLEAFLERDVDKAKRISQEDDEIDALYDQVYRELLLFMVEDPKTITRATWLLWVAHNLERFADRVTNICERVVFCVTGKMTDVRASKY